MQSDEKTHTVIPRIPILPKKDDASSGIFSLVGALSPTLRVSLQVSRHKQMPCHMPHASSY